MASHFASLPNVSQPATLGSATFCFLAGVDHTDVPANSSVPANTDSTNVWPALQVPNGTQSPRTEIFLSYAVNDGGVTDAGLIIGTKKIVCGHQANQGFWQSKIYPNQSSASVDPPYETYRLHQTFLLILSPFRSTVFFGGAGMPTRRLDATLTAASSTSATTRRSTTTCV